MVWRRGRAVTPYVYAAASKSALGFDLLAAINAGRLKVHAPTVETGELYRELFAQASAATYELRAGQLMRWGVPEPKGHDDLLNALALCAQAGPLEARGVAVGCVALRGWCR